ncbi:hypothetical protein [Acidianus sp. HS-5]|uniref:hypothetical protein n=1 Tax=Acidianus sp. HS-5 TaxID=2886040 RepID=UPI001F1DBAD3|nr:hypothetical protein [Acidianus sp. HS-5]BDC17202.1 hypothetical protein HS5_00920 [Acidianus sp. HS-5]
MGFNGIAGAVNEPGQIPWELVALYFIVALAIAFLLGKRTGGLKAFNTLDLIYIGIGSAFAVAWEFYIAGFLDRFIPSSPFISVSFWGRIIIVFIVAALVRKVGVGMLTLFIFDVLGDLFHYGFGGEPMYFIYETFTYGLFVDLMIAATGGRIFALPNFASMTHAKTPSPQIQATQISDDEDVPAKSTAISTATFIVGAIEGAIIGLLWAFPDPVFYDGFLRPFIEAKVANWGYIYYHIYAYMPGDAVAGIIGAIIAIIVARAVGS